MFLSYFKLEKQPFGATPDPQFLYQGASHREALASLYCSFYANRGFAALIAEPGMGKTTLLLEFLDHLQHRARTVFLSTSLYEPEEILSLILQELEVTPGRNLADRHRQLNEIVLAEARAGRRLVLVVDEAQNLSIEALEIVRLLTNFETRRSKLIQIVLAGQPLLADTLAKPELAQILQRISTICRLEPLSAAETAAYIKHRLKLAGYSGTDLFTPNALQLIAELSHGIPRIINTLCFNTLCLCRAQNSMVVQESMVGEAIADLQLPLTKPVHATENAEHKIHIFPQFTAIRVSSGRTARYVAASLLATCLGIMGALWSTGPAGAHLPFSLAAVISHIRLALPMKAAAAPPLPVVLHAQPVSAAISTLAASNNPVLTAGADSAGAPEPKAITIAQGDTLESIATRYLGDYNRTVLKRIQALNPLLTDPNHIESGRTIRLPEHTSHITPDVLMRNKP